MEVRDINYKIFDTQVSSNIQWDPSVRGSVPGGRSYSKIDFSPTLKKLTSFKESVKRAPPAVMANITMPPPLTQEGRYANAMVAALKHAEDVKTYQSQSSNVPAQPSFPTATQAAPSMASETDRPTAAMENVMVGGHHHSVVESIAAEPRIPDPEMSVQTNFHSVAGGTGKSKKSKKPKKKPYERPPLAGGLPSPVSPYDEYVAGQLASWRAEPGGALSPGSSRRSSAEWEMPGAFPVSSRRDSTHARRVSFVPETGATVQRIASQHLESRMFGQRPIAQPRAGLGIPRLSRVPTSVPVSQPFVRSKRAGDDALQGSSKKRRLAAPVATAREVVLQPRESVVERFMPTQQQSIMYGQRPIAQPRAEFGISRLRNVPTTVPEPGEPFARGKRAGEPIGRAAKRQKTQREMEHPIGGHGTFDPSVFGSSFDGHFRAGSNHPPLREIARAGSRYGVEPIAEHVIPRSAPWNPREQEVLASRAANEVRSIRRRPRAGQVAARHVAKKRRLA